MFTALTCPQCGGTLPRQALWRTVACPFCRATITRVAETIRRAVFHEAYVRSFAIEVDGSQILRVGEKRYRLLGRLGTGEHTDVMLAEACGTMPTRVTIKLARSSSSRLHDEAETLSRLQALGQSGSAYFSQRLPQVEACGRVVGGGDEARDALVLRHPSGFWGSIADVSRLHPRGIADVRHVVWLWRRVLEVLGYLHTAGWTHDDLRPEHWLVHPADHGVLLIGWSRAREGGDPARDLMQSAWTIRALLAGAGADGDTAPSISSRVPRPLADLLRLVSEDTAWRRTQDTASLERALMQAAAEAFGPPQFVSFNPHNA